MQVTAQHVPVSYEHELSPSLVHYISFVRNHVQKTTVSCETWGTQWAQYGKIRGKKTQEEKSKHKTSRTKYVKKQALLHKLRYMTYIFKRAKLLSLTGNSK